jgi:hypothetical protein
MERKEIGIAVLLNNTANGCHGLPDRLRRVPIWGAAFSFAARSPDMLPAFDVCHGRTVAAQLVNGL